MVYFKKQADLDRIRTIRPLISNAIAKQTPNNEILQIEETRSGSGFRKT
jgi:hypothetical protein